MKTYSFTPKHVALLLVLVAVAVGAAAAMGGWKWHNPPTKSAGWTWDDGQPSFAPSAGPTA
jgi:hypothetical protein